MTAKRQVRVLMSPRSSTGWAAGSIQEALEDSWDVAGVELTYQLSKSIEDGKEKAKRAVESGVDTLLVVGGDGMVNSIGSAMIGSRTALGVIPAGSGNGFARHFDIPLKPENAAGALIEADRRVIDVGMANGQPFFVTCSMAWDAALVRSFEKIPVRGVLPYFFAAASEYLGFVPQPFDVTLDGTEKIIFSDPLVFTAANLTQYGGGARIAPQASPDDGLLELVVISSQDAPRVLASLNRLFDGTIDQLPGVYSKRFHSMDVHRAAPGPIQIDGELVEAPADVAVRVLPKALTILVPRASH
jgi:diacylglycerol kinase family enzyme